MTMSIRVRFDCQVLPNERFRGKARGRLKDAGAGAGGPGGTGASEAPRA